MSTVLIVTLGTSPEPIINCISSLRPDRVVFLCSSESQKQVDTVLSKVPLPDFQAERDLVVLQQRISGKGNDDMENELDQLDRVYLRALDLFERVRDENRRSRIIADYTGGTKTMTTGLAMAAIDDGEVELNLTTSQRTSVETEASRFNYSQAAEILGSIINDRSLSAKQEKVLKKLCELLDSFKKLAKNAPHSIVSGYSAPVAVSTAAIHARRLRDRELPSLLRRHDYEAARQAVRRVQTIADPDPGTTQWLRWLEALMVGLDAWDRFDHRRAHEVLAGLADEHINQSLLPHLRRVIASRCLLDREAESQRWPQMKGHGLEAVEDLLRNAERRACQERYDDAVGRLYRAMELTEQLLLKIGVCDQVGPDGILTEAVAVDRLPGTIQQYWQAKIAKNSPSENDNKSRPLKIGLADGFDLLADLGHPTGLNWRERRPELVNAINTRNRSLFAHGFQPIGYSGWRELSGHLGEFLQAAIQLQCQNHGNRSSQTTPLPQLPASLSEMLCGDNKA
ncbi:MAG: TIGR02710 family CRISPR-associated CARF protein [Cyanobacteriota bacterium]